MSGFVSLIAINGAPADAELLNRLARTLRPRGPDAMAVQTLDAAGLGHTLLRTTDDARDERQPWTADRRAWIVADLRLDAREDLIGALSARGQHGLDPRPDVELVWQAYRTWGDACLERLTGDFSVAIWDQDRRRLFSARDQLGVKPLFYALTRTHLIVTNTIDCVRRHPAVSTALNDVAIADFLVTGANQDPEATVFADVQRVPPAHALTWDEEHGVRLRRYWTMPVDAPIRYRRASDYVERFREVFGRAVADRLRTGRAVVFMSGGLDSTSVALGVRRNPDPEVRRCDLQAFTSGYNRLIPDEELRYAALAARAIDLPIRTFAVDDYEPYGHWHDPRCLTPEPVAQVFMAFEREQQRAVTAHARIALTGYGADPLFMHLTDVIGSVRRRDPRPIVADVVGALRTGRLPPIGVRTTLRSWWAPSKGRSTYALPRWLDSAFVRHLHLAERYAALGAVPPGDAHPTRELSRRQMLDPGWARVFESYDPAVTGIPLEYRHPFFDLRVIRYVWAIPPTPWSQDKTLLRDAMRGILPDEIRLRRKTPLGGDPLAAWCENAGVRERLRTLVTAPRSTCCPTAFPPVLDDPTTRWANLRPIALEYWLGMSGLGMAPIGASPWSHDVESHL